MAYILGSMQWVAAGVLSVSAHGYLRRRHLIQKMSFQRALLRDLPIVTRGNVCAMKDVAGFVFTAIVINKTPYAFSYEDDKQQLVENWDLASATQFGHSVCVSRAWGCYRATRRHVMEGGDIEDRDTAG
ncbi:hypothetical protein M0657_001632 [Pyricularia oryzae]|uniref:Uncharacterized protein n=5 Tax=Pyricularia oryzae TaxID=318829 RepID=Q2KGI2_PYRO7|nr:hypothetical protein MGCH7_ch7g353 [Pyricularia oryzae 70-15]ELQ36323.1 hypothetical protein OOU_Y34scaffold00666g184 [Pyricularia oryzae Y34]KAI7929958.1 hypothetical protein M9X92_001076 [Pyricularia oryzae]KAI7930512.1 hypothetical protein M0657_001632 [Pyricularia oryzae]QBZ66166.1 hypothetical protein PoMZ_13137 [Pyricularia oryzae]